MITTYILVLGVSAWLLAFLLLYVSKRFGKLFGNPQLVSAGFILLLPLLGFLTIVAAPPTMLVGCILLAGAHLTRTGGYLPTIARWGVPLIAAVLAGTHLPMVSIVHIPPIVPHLAALLVLFGYAWSADYLPSRLAPASIGILACAIPLLAAPFFGAPSYIAVDILILSSALLGANMMVGADASIIIARQPFGLILGWLAVAAATYGAWIPAVISLLIYGAFLAKTLATSSMEREAHAS
jgi:hypothetical protein